jgi:hypothetical protein
MTKSRIFFIVLFVIAAGVVFSLVAPNSSPPASNPGQGAQVAEKTGEVKAVPTPASKPKDTQEPSVSAPIITTTALTSSLRFNRHDIQAVYEGLWHFKFQPGNEVQGQPRLVGKAANGLALIELIGNDEEIPRASIALSFPRNAPQAAAENSIYMAQLLTLAAPDWEEGGQWLSNGITEAFKVEKVETTHDDLDFTLQVHKELGMIVFTVESTASSEPDSPE